MNKNVRDVAFQVLYDVIFQEGYSNILLQHTTLENKSDQGLLAEIVYGTLQNYLRYEHEMTAWDEKRFTPRARIISAMALYQIEFLDRVPSYAIYAEATKLAKTYVRKEEKRIYAFLQTLPKKILNQKRENLKTTIDQTDIDSLSKKERNQYFELVSLYYSFPRWICQLIYNQSKDVKQMHAYLRYHNTRPQNTIRIRDAYKDEAMSLYQLEDDVCLHVDGNPEQHPFVIEKKAVVQDRASQQLRNFLPKQKPNKVLDMCASPGGKSVLCADFYHDQVSIIANDLHEHKVDRMEAYFNRLGVENITANLSPGEQLQNQFLSGTFDLVLLDAPCSGLGVIRRRPEIRYRIQPEDLDQLETLQNKLLETAYALLSPGGVCVYSTCTVNKKENQNHFTEGKSQFILDGEPFSTYGEESGSDGFYIQRLKK
ncbi:MAG: transcription antitermination factor NusB [Culicoidibacterales bacterium]